MAIQTHIRAPLLLLAAIATAAAKLTPEWRVVSAAKGVTTRARIDATSQLCAVHGEAVVEASVAELMSVFGDLDQHGHWDATLVDARGRDVVAVNMVVQVTQAPGGKLSRMIYSPLG